MASWKYAIRERRLVELWVAPNTPDLDGCYVVLDWRDTWDVLRNIRWVIRDLTSSG